MKPTHLNIQVVDTAGKPVPEAEVTVGWSWSYDVSGKTGPESDRSEGVADTEGRYTFFGITRGGVAVSAVKDGFYRTFTGPVEDDPVLVELRKKVNPTPLYAKQASLDLPSGEGRFGYDLFEGDLVAPHGVGKRADLFFVVHRTTSQWRGQTQYQLHGDVEFPHRDDGIQSFFILNRTLPQSQYLLPFTTRTTGYLPTLHDADQQYPNYFRASVYMNDPEAPEPWYWTEKYRHKGEIRDWSEEVHYLIRVRSGTADGACYGLVRGSFRFGIHGADTPNVSFEYYLNPDHTTNIEYDRKLNLIPALGRYRAPEYRP